jgi:hypothetical protein
MSKYEQQQTNICEGTHLVAALKALGFNPTLSESPAHLMGYQGDARAEVAHIIIPKAQVGGASNDIGFLKVNGRYEAIISQFDQRKYNADWLGKLSQHYSISRKIAKAKSLGYRVTKQWEENGKIMVKLEGR